MRLLHVTATHLNPTGGIPVVLRDLVDAQNMLEKVDARVLSLKADTSNMQSQYFDYIGDKRFNEYIETFQPDIVIFHSHYYIQYVKAFEVLIKKGIPYFIEPHGSFGKAALEKSKYKKMLANNTIFKKYLKKAEGYIFLNEREKEDSRLRTKNDLVIPNGVNCDVTSNNDVKDSSWFFYYIGRYDINHKGLDYLFEALQILEEESVFLRFNLYGKGNAKDEEYVNRRCRDFRKIQIKNCGPLYGEDQEKTLSQCGIMLLTSRYEGFPMTVLEAWKYGNPVIVTPGTNLDGEVKLNNLGWTCKLDSHCIASAIEEAIESYEMNRKKYITRVKAYVNEYYTWAIIAEKSYYLLYDKINKSTI